MHLHALRIPAPAAGLLAVLLVSCTGTTVKPVSGTAPKTNTVFVLVGGGHTELALPAAELPAPLAIFRSDFPGVRFLAFGWGERAYYMASHPGIGQTLRAGFPAASVLRVTGLEAAPTSGAGIRVIPVQVSRRGLNALSRYIRSYVAIRENGAPRRLGSAGAAGVFYASGGTYDLFHTCNTWTAQALHVAGLSVNARGVVLARQVVSRLRQIERPDTATKPPASTAHR